nr:NFACT RNA binding domain-containing protein [Fulvivirga sedimenti]
MQGYKKRSLEEQYREIMDLIHSLETPVFHITDWQEQIVLSLFRLGNVRRTFNDPIEALNEFYLTYQREGNLLREKRRAGDVLRKDLERSLRYIEKNQIKLIEIRDQTNYRQMADLIMAHMHEIRQGEKLITVPDFYQNNVPVEIKLKPDLSPQKNAENYYRKAKNQHLETDRLEKNIRTKKQQMEEQKALLDKIESAETVRDLKKIVSRELPENDNDGHSRPFHVFTYMGFQVWLGKSGKANDQMLRLSHKDDLWLHAKDVAGAHVIIKHNPGTGFPAGVKEKAASLAAFHSKRKNDSMCPVIATPRKFIRKRKGAPAGEVAVDREEEILLVSPENWD